MKRLIHYPAGRVCGLASNPERLHMRPTVRFVLIFLLGFVLAACGARINQENYEKVKNDMSVQEVNRILGKPTDVSSFAIGGLSASTAKWVGKTHTITVTYANERVKMKSYAENSPAARP